MDSGVRHERREDAVRERNVSRGLEVQRGAKDANQTIGDSVARGGPRAREASR
jgi:hypothetical protein